MNLQHQTHLIHSLNLIDYISVNGLIVPGLKTTKAKRIAQSVTALAAGMQFGEMLRAIKAKKDQWYE